MNPKWPEVLPEVFEKATAGIVDFIKNHEGEESLTLNTHGGGTLANQEFTFSIRQDDSVDLPNIKRRPMVRSHVAFYLATVFRGVADAPLIADTIIERLGGHPFFDETEAHDGTRVATFRREGLVIEIGRRTLERD